MVKRKKIIIICCVVFLLIVSGLMTAYFINSKKPKYQLTESSYTLNTGFTFTTVQVTGMKDKALERKINDSLGSYFFIMEEPAWFSEEHVDEMPYIIHCQTERYLSVEYRFDNRYSDLAKNDWYHHCVTVDMNTGELVCLDDLVRVDESFANFVKYGGVLHCPKNKFMDWTEEEASQELNNEFLGFETDHILRIFRHYTSEYLYGDFYRNLWPELGPASGDTGLYIHNFFYIEDGYIYMQYGEPNYQIMWIATEDIEDYLLVPVW